MMLTRSRAGLFLQRAPPLPRRPHPFLKRTRKLHNEPPQPPKQPSEAPNTKQPTEIPASPSTSPIAPTPEAIVAPKTPSPPISSRILANPILHTALAPVRAFTRSQHSHPYITQLVSSLVVYLLGDLSAQHISREILPNGTTKEFEWDPLRTLRALIIGGLAAVPGYNWFLWLSNSFNYKSFALSIATKVVVNQVFFTPLFNSYFFGMQSLLTGGGPQDIWERIKSTVPRSWINSWKLWPAVTAVNMAWVPLHFRGIFAGE
jgi:protein Mpv17